MGAHDISKGARECCEHIAAVSPEKKTIKKVLEINRVAKTVVWNTAESHGVPCLMRGGSIID